MRVTSSQLHALMCISVVTTASIAAISTVYVVRMFR